MEKTYDLENPNTYEIRLVNDFLKVPVDRREICVREVLYALCVAEISTIAGSDIGETWKWIDDNKMEVTLTDINDSELQLKVGLHDLTLAEKQAMFEADTLMVQRKISAPAHLSCVSFPKNKDGNYTYQHTLIDFEIYSVAKGWLHEN